MSFNKSIYFSQKQHNILFLRFGDKVLAEKRDSFIDSENESHRTGEPTKTDLFIWIVAHNVQFNIFGIKNGPKNWREKNNEPINIFVIAGDDSDAFADDEAPSSDGMEERDDISLVSTVSSVSEDDKYKCKYKSKYNYKYKY